MKKTVLSLVAAAAVSTSLFADAELEALKQRIADLEARQNTVIDETSDLKTGFAFEQVDTSFSHKGMGAAASKVYNSKSPLSIGGYAEMFYANKQDANNIADVYRFVPYIGYKFTDNIIFNTEIEFEHGGAGQSNKDSGKEGKVIVEFMYLDFLISDAFNLQVGNILTPMGLVNLRHEPTLFNTVQRPNVEKRLIPSTWNTNGVLAYGNIGESGFSYNAGFIQALNFDNSDAGERDQIRTARDGSTYESVYNNAAFVGRLDYNGAGVMAGASLYYGTASQGTVSGASALMYDLHATYENSGFKAKAVYTATEIDDAQNLALNGANTGGQSTESANGYYVNLEYDVLATMNSEYKLPLFVQYDYINPIDTVVDGTGATITGTDLDAESATTTVGLNFFPHEQVVLKVDYAMIDYEDASVEDQDILSLSFGLLF
jgi:hypothetical protein